MTAPVPPTDAYVPVDMRWRLVRPGDVVLSPMNDAPWMVTEAFEIPGACFTRRFVHAGRTFADDFDPDQTVRVLVPWPEAAGIVLLREGLGPVRVLDRGEVA